MKPLSYTEAIVAGKTCAVVLITYDNMHGDTVHCYLLSTLKELLLLRKEFADKHKASPMIDLHNFGTVLEYGYGAPDADVKKRVEEEWGFDTDQGVMLPELETQEAWDNLLAACRAAEQASDSAA